MAKWVFDQWDNVMEYPTLGFIAEPGDILDSLMAPDWYWVKRPAVYCTRPWVSSWATMSSLTNPLPSTMPSSPGVPCQKALS